MSRELKASQDVIECADMGCPDKRSLSVYSIGKKLLQLYFQDARNPFPFPDYNYKIGIMYLRHLCDSQ